ncbi:unnamed protein product [Paramecium sonneborni]|uniref:USP domain-containing protein n=1 Tax=Paramecium sonneborni TaxID=65129 RepID=A0A8S1KHD3_9CILI|nr:unnamed protein product [Paramecium sonneborni]
MNSVLQMLYKLEQFMLDIDEIYTNSKENSFLITYYFMETFYLMNNQEMKPEWLNQFRQVISSQFPQFKLNEQQDAQEFLLALLDMLHEELRNPKCGKMPIFEFQQDGQVMLTSLVSYLEFENSPITKHFGNIIRTQIICQSCNYSNNKLEIAFSLLINVEGSKNTVLEMLQQSFNKEVVKMKCPKCELEKKFIKQTTVIKYSEQLIICLNRYRIPGGLIDRWLNGNEIQKSTKQITLNNKFIIGQSEKTLIGIVDHSGNKDKGHYRYFHLSGNDWVCFNDAKINLLCEQSIQKLIHQNETSYILLYSQQQQQ